MLSPPDECKLPPVDEGILWLDLCIDGKFRLIPRVVYHFISFFHVRIDVLTTSHPELAPELLIVNDALEHLRVKLHRGHFHYEWPVRRNWVRVLFLMLGSQSILALLVVQIRRLNFSFHDRYLVVVKSIRSFVAPLNLATSRRTASLAERTTWLVLNLLCVAEKYLVFEHLHRIGVKTIAHVELIKADRFYLGAFLQSIDAWNVASSLYCNLWQRFLYIWWFFYDYLVLDGVLLNYNFNFWVFLALLSFILDNDCYFFFVTSRFGGVRLSSVSLISIFEVSFCKYFDVG